MILISHLLGVLGHKFWELSLLLKVLGSHSVDIQCFLNIRPCLSISDFKPQIQNPESQVTIENSFLALVAENIKR